MVVGLPLRQFLLGVELGACIVGMLSERLAGPFRDGAGVVVVALRVEDVVHREFAPDDQLLEIGRAVITVAVLGGADRERDLDRRDVPEMQKRAHMRGRPGLRLVAAGAVAGESILQESLEAPACLGVAAAEPLHRADRGVERQLREKPVRVREVEAAFQLQPLGQILGPMLDLPRCHRFEILVPQPLQLRAQGARGVFVLGRGGLDRYHHVALDLDDPALRLPSDLGVPAFLDREIAAVEHQKGCLSRQVDGDLCGGRPPQEEGDAARVQSGRRVGKPLQQEGVVPGIGLGEPVGSVEQAETDEKREAEAVGFLDRQFQRRIERDAHGLLHQVQHVVRALARRHVVQDPDAGRLDRHRSKSPRLDLSRLTSPGQPAESVLRSDSGSARRDARRIVRRGRECASAANVAAASRRRSRPARSRLGGQAEITRRFRDLAGGESRLSGAVYCDASREHCIRAVGADAAFE